MIDPENWSDLISDEDDGDDTPEHSGWTYLDDEDWIDEPDTGVYSD